MSVIGRRIAERVRPRSVWSGLTVVAVVVLVAAMGAAVWFGIGWGRAQFVQRPVSEARDDALAAASAAAVNLSSFDIGNLDASFAKIDSVVTGQLAADLTANRPMLTQTLLDRHASSTATVTAAAVVDLDRDALWASAVVVLRQITSGAGGPEQAAVVTTLVGVQKVGDRWLASEAQPLGNKPLDAGGN